MEQEAGMSASELIRLVLADDHQMVREPLARMCQESGAIEFVGQAVYPHHAMEIIAQTAPHVVVMDYSMPEMTAPSAIEAMRSRWPGLKILILTVHENIHYAVKVLESG